MRFQTTSEYAIRALIYIGSKNSQVVTVRELHEQLNIPYKYLTRIMTHLKKFGFLIAIRGKNGGFLLAKELNEIHLHKILEVIQGLEEYNRCLLGFETCSQNGTCAIHEYVITAKKKFEEAIYSLTLADLVNAHYDKA